MIGRIISDVAVRAAKEKEDDSQDANDHKNGIDAALRGGSVGIDFWRHVFETGWLGAL